MIFHSCLVSNSRFQDVVKKFSNSLYFKNEAFEWKKILFHTFELFFLRSVYVPPVMDTLYTEQNKRELPREIWKTSPFCSFVQFLTRENTERTQESRRNHVLPFWIHSTWLCVTFQHDASSSPVLWISSHVRIV